MWNDIQNEPVEGKSQSGDRRAHMLTHGTVRTIGTNEVVRPNGSYRLLGYPLARLSGMSLLCRQFNVVVVVREPLDIPALVHLDRRQ